MDFIKDLNFDSIRNIAEDAYNQAKPKSDLEARIYECLSHKNWGSSSTLLNEIAQYSYDFDKYPVIIRLLWEGLDQRPAAWRVVFKALILLEHLIKNGSERCVDDARNRSHQLRALGNFNYYEGTIDRGLGVKEKSKQIIEILEDDSRIREERSKAKKLRDKLGQLSTSSSGGGGGGKYAGYGKDDSNSGGGGYGNSSYSGGGSGYGNSGIGADKGSGNGGFSGRYSDESANATPAVSSSAPTFATLPEVKPAKKPTKVKKLKKKKKLEASKFNAPDEPAPAPAPVESAPDLFSFDDQPAAASNATTPADDEFDAFASASKSTVPKQDEFDAFASATVKAPSDAFDAFAGSPTPSVPTTATAGTFDAFANAPATSAQTSSPDVFGALASSSSANAATPATFDAFASASQPQPTGNAMNAFGGTNNMMGGANNMMGGANNMMMMQQQQQQQQMMMMQQQQQQQQMMNMMGNISVNQSGSNMSNSMGGNTGMKKSPSKPNPTSNGDDDFGDFSGADSKADTGSSDPMSKLIQLDSLTTNKKKEDKTKEPIIYNEAAATSFATQSSFGAATNTPASFAGIDGLNKTIDISVKSAASNRQPGQPIMTSVGAGLSTTPAGMGMNQMANGMIANQNMMGGMQPNMMMNNQMAGMMPNMVGGMQPNMMMMNNQMGMGGGNGMMMNGMGGQSNGGDGTKGKNNVGSMMGGQTMGGSGVGGTMGGQPMGMGGFQ